MNKFILFISLFVCFSNLAQVSKKEPTLENFQRRYKYVKSRSYTGPEQNPYISPADMEDIDDSQSGGTYSGGSNGGGTINYSPQQIQDQRESKYGKGNGSGGNLPEDPEMGKPEPIEFDPPDIDSPDVDLPDVDAPSISPQFWKILGIILLALIVIFLIYYIFKNYRPINQRVTSTFSVEEWNPEEISKSELELRLEEALLREDYRECVRIYFTFILKEMIRLKRIRWKKDLTNYDYILQSSSSKNHYLFEETVRIYDLVWYGEYQIKAREYQVLSTHLDHHYKLLNQENA